MYYPEQISKPETGSAKLPESDSGKVPEQLASAVMIACYINGGDAEDRARALDVEGRRLLALSDSASPETVQTLASHLPVLEALFLRLAKDAVICKSATDKAKLLKASLQAQASYGRTVALLGKLKKRAERWDTMDERQ